MGKKMILYFFIDFPQITLQSCISYVQISLYRQNPQLTDLPPLVETREIAAENMSGEFSLQLWTK